MHVERFSRLVVVPWRQGTAPPCNSVARCCPPVANLLDPARPPRLAGAMRMLVLGGTAWLGHTVAQEAQRRGHDVTCLARGSADPPPGASFVVADRDLDDGLAAVAGETWDAVVDVTRHPG